MNSTGFSFTHHVLVFEKPFLHFVIENTAAGLANLPKDPIESLQDLRVNWEGYDNKDEKKALCRDLSQFPPELAILFRHFMHSNMIFTLRKYAQELGIENSDKLVADETLHGGGIHVVRTGGHLGVHIDYALHPKLDPPMERRLNMILFLVPRWEERWGGALQLYDDEGREVVHSVYPAPYRAVLWANTDTSFHGTQPVSEDCPVPRMSANIYYIAPARPGANRKRALFVPNRG